MISYDTQLRVRYSETDQMGYVYYGQYAAYFEVGRVELIRSIGMPYRKVEELGIIMPVSDMTVKYIRPAHYDDLLTIHTYLDELPSSRFVIHCKIYNETGTLLVKGTVKLAFVNKESMRPVRVPDFILEATKLHWKDEESSR